MYIPIIKCKYPLPKMHFMLDFICMGSVELSGTHSKQNYLKLIWTLMFHWRRQPYFSREPLSKTGYKLGVCHISFHLHMLTRTVRSAIRELQNEKFWSKVVFEPVPSAYKANSLSVALLEQISIEHLNVDRVLPECAIKIYMYRVPRGRCSKMFSRVLHFIYSLQSANVLIHQTVKRFKYYMKKIHDESFCYIYHVVQVILKS